MDKTVFAGSASIYIYIVKIYFCLAFTLIILTINLCDILIIVKLYIKKNYVFLYLYTFNLLRTHSYNNNIVSKFIWLYYIILHSENYQKNKLYPFSFSTFLFNQRDHYNSGPKKR